MTMFKHSDFAIQSSLNSCLQRTTIFLLQTGPSYLFLNEIFLDDNARLTKKNSQKFPSIDSLDEYGNFKMNFKICWETIKTKHLNVTKLRGLAPRKAVT